MGILAELLNDIAANRPRLLNFRNARSQAEIPTPQTSKESIPETLALKEAGQYPYSRPEYENITDPFEWHQQMVRDRLARAKAYQDRKSAQMSVNKVSYQYSDSPPNPSEGAANLSPNLYNASVKFR